MVRIGETEHEHIAMWHNTAKNREIEKLQICYRTKNSLYNILTLPVLAGCCTIGVPCRFEPEASTKFFLFTI